MSIFSPIHHIQLRYFFYVRQCFDIWQDHMNLGKYSDNSKNKNTNITFWIRYWISMSWTMFWVLTLSLMDKLYKIENNFDYTLQSSKWKRDFLDTKILSHIFTLWISTLTCQMGRNPTTEVRRPSLVLAWSVQCTVQLYCHRYGNSTLVDTVPMLKASSEF